MKYLTKIDKKNIPADAKTVLEDVRNVFPGPTPEPILVHALHPPLLAAHWHMSKAVYFSGNYRREYKDIIASGISAANGCSYCREAHGTLVKLNFGDTGRAIEADTSALIEDSEQRELFQWSRATLSPDAEMLRSPKLVAYRTEIIGVALLYHYINRIVNVLFGESPLAVPKIPGLKRLVMYLARPAIRRIAKYTLTRPRAIDISGRNVFTWAMDDPIIDRSFAAFDRTADAAVADVLDKPTMLLVEAKIEEWRGESMPLSRAWVDHAVSDAPPDERPASRLALLTALDSRRVTNDDVLAYRQRVSSDADLLKLLAWASFQATKRIGSWL